MGKRASSVDTLFVPAEVEAAEDLGIKLSSEYVRRMRQSIKTKAAQMKGQYYTIIDDADWTDDELDDRLFATVRLLHEYEGGSGSQISMRTERMEALKQLILRIAEKKKANHLPIVRKIRNDALNKTEAAEED